MQATLDQSTALLLKSSPSGEGPQWEEIYHRVGPALHGWFALHLHGSLRARLDAADLTQETWMRAMHNIASYDPTLGGFRSWLIGIARNVLREAFQDQVGHREFGGGTTWATHLSRAPDTVTSITQRIARADALSAFVERLRREDEESQVLVITCALEELPIAEAARRLNISVEAASKRWQRLRERLANGTALREIFGLVDD